MRNFYFVEHTADIRLIVEGSSQEELFHAALEGMANVLYHDINLPLVESFEIEIVSIDITGLLIDFLNEVLSKSLRTLSIFTNFKPTTLNELCLRGTLLGAKVPDFSTEIKAVTYHEAKVIRNSRGNLETRIIFDI